MHFSASLLATEYQNSSGCPTYAATTKSRWLRQGEPCPGGRGSRQARHGWRAPESGQDVLLREKRPPADRTRRPAGARAVDLLAHPRGSAEQKTAGRSPPPIPTPPSNSEEVVPPSPVTVARQAVVPGLEVA